MFGRNRKESPASTPLEKNMKRKEEAAAATESAQVVVASPSPTNGHSTASELMDGELSVILAGLQTMRDGDFSVRLPGAWTGLAGKVADTFNEIASANEQMSCELKRVGEVVGKEGRTRERTRF